MFQTTNQCIYIEYYRICIYNIYTLYNTVYQLRTSSIYRRCSTAMFPRRKFLAVPVARGSPHGWWKGSGHPQPWYTPRSLG